MSETLILERIDSHLDRLRLPRIKAILEETIKSAEEQAKSYLAFLDDLLGEEVAQKEQRRVETALKISGLPFVKSIDEFEFAFQPRLDKQKVMSLFDLSFIGRKENAIFLGPPGVGKTHLAVALAVKASQAGISIYFTSMEELIRKLKNDQQNDRQGRGRSYYKSALVIVDEVGYTPIDRTECNLFFRFVASRYEKASTIITSNKAFNDWAELFHDQVIVSAILDRLLHHCTIINIKGNSYRLKDQTLKMDKSEQEVTKK